MFRVIIRVVFLFAYAAFLYASLRHIAYFFSSFEPAGTDWTGAYALAISIDVTALILTIGVMFFKRGMPAHAVIGVWFFIVCLTGFSWMVNWEYAVQFQSSDLARATAFQWVNPILASSFAFLNLAYSVIAELFSSKPKTMEELQQELTDLQQRSSLNQQLSEIKNQQLSTMISGKVQALSQAFSRQKSPESEPTFEPKEPEIFLESAPDVAELPEESEPTSEEVSAPRLSMIEQAMYDALMKNPEEAAALQRLSQEQSLDDFMAMLKQRYSQYAGYITPQRVVNVMRFIARTSEEKSDESVPEIAQAKRKYVMTFQEASEYTGYEISTLKQQLKKGEIQATSSGKLLISSLKIKSGNTGKIVAIKSVEKGA